MRIIILLFLLSVTSCASKAQNTPVISQDTVAVNPNTVVVIAKVRLVGVDDVHLVINKVVGIGQGIVNIPAEGQEIITQIADQKTKLKTGDTVRATLKEKMGVDASQSSFIILSHSKQ
jgi:hypothetical protein